MANQEKITGTAEAWENGTLGRDEEYVQVADQVDEGLINDALGLQPISIRLQKSLIEDYKMIAEINGIGYQPLIRQVLKRFADYEKKELLRQKASEITEAGTANDDRDYKDYDSAGRAFG